MCGRRCTLVALALAAGLLFGAAQSAQAQPNVPIYEIQGAGHVSPYDGDDVTTTGVITAIAFRGFYLQDATGDGNDNTSDGIFVFTFFNNPPEADDGTLLEPGDVVTVVAEVQEFFPGGASTGNLSTTELDFVDSIVIESRGNPLPSAVIVGASGRVPPAVDVISADELPVNLQNAADDATNNFDPANDGIDFYESLEGMLVLVEDPVCVSGLRSFGSFSSEVFTLANDGAGVAPTDARTARGGISLQPHPDNQGDQNPERVQIQFDASENQEGTLYPGVTPPMNVGDRLASVLGVVGYDFGNYQVNAIEEVEVIPAGLTQERTRLVSNRWQTTLATYNVLNLSPLAIDDVQREELARQIVENLRSPDVIALQEIQDSNGAFADQGLPDDAPLDGVIDADETLQALADAIVAAGGPRYEYFDVDPADGTSGGIPGGNIRNAYLYNPRRVRLQYYFSLTPDVLTLFGASDPNAFAGTRNPLVARFSVGFQSFTVINNHLTSRFGSSPVFGGPQPFFQAGEIEREAQVQALNEVVNRMDQMWWAYSGPVVVLGDLNTFEFTNDLEEILPPKNLSWPWYLFFQQDVLKNLVKKLADDNVYSFNFEGNSQQLDHVFVSPSLYWLSEIDVVHTNVDFYRPDSAAGEQVGSDHEPIVIRFPRLFLW